MAADLIKKIGLLNCLLLCFFSAEVCGQVLSDPTRPPPGIGDPTQSPGMMAYPQERGLQSVIISPEHCAAIIDGKTIELGAKYGAEVLVEISEQGVVLQGGQGQHVLTLFPAVGMKITTAPSGKQAIKCRAGQNRQAISTEKKSVQKEKK